MAKVSLAAQLGIVPAAVATDALPANDEPAWPVVDNGKDYFVSATASSSPEPICCSICGVPAISTTWTWSKTR